MTQTAPSGGRAGSNRSELDTGVGMRAAQRGAVPHPGQDDVIHIARRAGHLGGAVRARRAVSDTVHRPASLEQGGGGASSSF